MKLLLVNPWIYDFAAYDLWLKPLGLLYLSNIFKNLNNEVYLIDCMDRFFLPSPKITQYGCGPYFYQNVDKPLILKHIPRKYKRFGLPLELFLKECEKYEPDVILVSSGMTYWYLGVFEAIKILKQKFPDIPIILGGVYATLCYEHALKNSLAHYVFKGNNIENLIAVIEKLTGKTIYNKKIPKDFSQYPPPDYSFYQTIPYIAIRTSVGCPLDCSYCGVKILQNRFIYKDPVKIFDEIKHFYQSLKVKNFVFYDDALLFSFENHLKHLLQLIIKNNFSIFFHTPNALHAKEITSDVAKLLFASGFVYPRLGLETINEERQKQMGGKVTKEEVKQAIKYLIEAGYKSDQIYVYVMIGLPVQTFEEVEETIYWVHRLGAKSLLAEFSPIPGTVEWKRANLPHNLDPLLHNNSIFPLFEIKDWKRIQELKNLARQLNKNI